MSSFPRICPSEFARLLLLTSLLALPFSVELGHAAVTATTASVTPIDRAQVRDRLETLLASVSTAIFWQRTWETNGDKTEENLTLVHWAGANKVHVEVKEGRAKGAAFLTGTTVYGFKPGLLSFIKLKYDLRDDKVLSIRGYDMTKTGYLDDVKLLLANWDEAQWHRDRDMLKVVYSGFEGLRSAMWIQLNAVEGLPVVAEQKVWEDGEVVETYKYWDIRYNVPIDPDLFEK